MKNLFMVMFLVSGVSFMSASCHKNNYTCSCYNRDTLTTSTLYPFGNISESSAQNDCNTIREIHPSDSCSLVNPQN
jgi:hypothetical protein